MHVPTQLQIELTATSEFFLAWQDGTIFLSLARWDGPFILQQSHRVESTSLRLDDHRAIKFSRAWQCRMKTGASRTSTHLIGPECTSVTTTNTMIIGTMGMSRSFRPLSVGG